MIDLKDVTFIIPVRLSHPDRITNLKTSIGYLQKYFDTNIIIKEYDDTPKAHEYISLDNITYLYEQCIKDAPFYRTKLLNDMLKLSKTNITVNYDMDIILTTDTILKAREMIKTENFDVFYPYNNKTLNSKKISKTSPEYSRFIETIEANILDEDVLKFKPYGNVLMCGGCIWFKTSVYKAGGGENELFVDWGPEDKERLFRFEKLGYNIGRVPEGKIFHLEHEKAANVSQTEWPDYIKNNHTKYNLIIKMNKEQIKYFAKINSQKFNV